MTPFLEAQLSIWSVKTRKIWIVYDFRAMYHHCGLYNLEVSNWPLSTGPSRKQLNDVQKFGKYPWRIPLVFQL